VEEKLFLSMQSQYMVRSVSRYEKERERETDRDSDRDIDRERERERKYMNM